MSQQRQYSKAPKPTYYRHFTLLAKGIQRRGSKEVQHSVEEQAYEWGCARTVGCAGGQTFDMLVALPKSVMCAAPQDCLVGHQAARAWSSPEHCR